jgi:hypothetical protein
MKKRALDNVKTAIVLIPLIILAGITKAFPWWGFVIPVFIVGIIVTVKKWEVSAFGVGFLSGFIIWFGVSVYFDLTSDGAILYKLGMVLSVPKIIVILISGLLGGLLAGLALYSGKSIVFKKADELPIL